MSFTIHLTRQAVRDLEQMKKCSQSRRLQGKFDELIKLLEQRPHGEPPPVKVLNGDLKGLWVRRLSEEHRLVYRIDDANKAVVIVSAWTHYHKK